jgi:hypothetical protein
MQQNNPVRDTGGIFTKVDAIIDAYSQLTISGITVDPTPEDLELALDRLEGMASEWATRNICDYYNFEDEPDPNSLTNVKRGYKQAFATNLAVRLIPDFKKTVPDVLFKQATQSLSNLSGRSAMERINGVPYPTRQPRGSGNTLRYNRWNRFYRNQNVSPNSCATNRMVIGDINDYVEHYDAYLNDGEVIDSFSIILDPGLRLISSSNTDNEIEYRIEARTGDTNQGNQQLTIVMDTDSGRRETRYVFFNLIPRERYNA